MLFTLAAIQIQKAKSQSQSPSPKTQTQKSQNPKPLDFTYYMVQIWKVTCKDYQICTSCITKHMEFGRFGIWDF